jgi:hypothetical protein
MEKLRNLSEIFSNLAIILLAVVLGYVVVSRFSPATLSTPPRDNPAGLTAGTQLPQIGLDWGKSDRHLLLVLSTTCRYCTDSLPFYRKLIEKRGTTEGPRVVAMFPQSQPEATAYLASAKLEVDEILQNSPGAVLARAQLRRFCWWMVKEFSLNRG